MTADVTGQHEEPTPITGHGGVAFDAAGQQLRTKAGVVVEDEETSEPLISDEKANTILNAMEIAATVASITKHHPKINPSVGVQIVALAMQAAAQDAQTRMLYASPPEEPSDG